MIRREDICAPPDRNELSAFLLSLCVVSGLTGLLDLAPNPNAAHLPWWINIPWYLLLFAGGVLAVVGTYWRDPVSGLLIERAALWPIGGGAAMYSVALGAKGLWLPAAVTLWFAIAVVRRAIRIPGMIRQMRFVRQSPAEQGGGTP